MIYALFLLRNSRQRTSWLSALKPDYQTKIICYSALQDSYVGNSILSKERPLQDIYIGYIEYFSKERPLHSDVYCSLKSYDENLLINVVESQQCGRITTQRLEQKTKAYKQRSFEDCKTVSVFLFHAILIQRVDSTFEFVVLFC